MNDRLKKLLEFKNYEKMSLEELIEAYIALYVKNASKAYEEVITELLIYIEKFKSSKETILQAIDTASAKLNITPPQAALTALLQEKTAQKTGVKAVFGAPAQRAINIVNERMMWVGNDAKKRTQETLKNIYSKAYSGELMHNEFMNELRENFESYKELELHKLKAAADFNLRQNSNMGVVRMGLEHNFAYVQVVAVVDSHTTMICLSMNNRIIPLKQLKPQYEDILGADNVKEAKSTANLNLETKGFWDKKLPSNFGIPPYHFGCRTSLRLISQAQYNTKKGWIDEFGREFGIVGGIGGSVWEKIRTKADHLPKSGYNSVTELLHDTMNNIVRVGTHSGHAAMIIQGRNGFFIVMNYKGEIETCYKPEKGAERLYNENELRTYYDTSILRGIKKWLENLI
jgi:hypothetical protein